MANHISRSFKPCPCNLRSRGSRFGLALLLGSSLLFGGAAIASELRETPIVKAVQRVRGAVVNIRGEKTISAPVATVGQSTAAEGTRRVNGMGTGVIIDARGYIMTNYHVVDGVHEIAATTADGQRYTARLVARDAETDLAIIKIESNGVLPVIPIATSSDLMPGETVIALGNAYGYENTVTRGIVSALHRAVQISDAQYYDDLIQTDASINPGNSGGPLLNIDGNMIGVNVAVRAGAQGIGFAIPADKVTMVAARLLASCGTQRGWLGVVTASEPASTGMVVGKVEPNSPAAEAGLNAGDTIVRVDDVEIQRPLDFQRAMLERKPGEKCLLVAQHAGAPRTLNVRLAEPPETPKLSDQPAWDILGLELQSIRPDIFRQNHQTHYHGGLKVTAVRPNSPASNEGIRPGDVLVGMHEWETVSMENVSYVLKRREVANLSPMKFFILRDNETLYGYFQLGAPKTAQR
jgi:serine protease Do